MTPAQSSRTARLILAVALVLVVVVGVTVALVGFSTPGYAGSKTPNLILQALLQENPTPVPTPVAAACGVRIAQRMTIVTDTMGIELSNDGAAATVQAITVAWPTANGELREVKLGERAIWTGAAAGGSATVFLDLAEMLPTIKTSEQILLTLLFSNPAADDDYMVLLHLGNSCYAMFDSSRNAAQLASCFVTFDRFDVNEQEAALVVRNTTTEPISFSQLLVFWPDGHGPVSSIQIDDGENLISGPAEKSPLVIPLPADPAITLQAEQSLTLRLVFDGTAPLVNYTIVFQSNECQSVFSNAEAPAECPVRQEGDLQVIGQTVGLVLQNLSEASHSVEGIWLTFPVSNTALVDVILDDTSIIVQSSGRFPKVSSPATMTAGVDLRSDVSLRPNSRSTMGLVFQQDAALQHYTVELDLSGECRILTTTRSEDPEPCRMEVDGDAPIRTEGNQLRLAIRNTGAVPAELVALQVDWEPQFNGALTGVALEDVLFSEGERTGGTATVTHDTDTVVPPVQPGQSAELQLTFSNEVVTAPYVLRLDFAEGCSLSYATQPNLAMPTPIEIGGTIDQLPPDAFDGEWYIRLSPNEVVAVQVTSQTVVEPQGLTPLINDVVRARVLQTGENQYLATRVRVFAQVVEPTQFSGLIEEVDLEQPPRFIIVQGLRVDILTPGTLVDGDLFVGWLADCDGDLRPDGSVLARSIHTTEPTVQQVDFRGFVEDWQEISEAETLWILSGLRAIVNQYTTIHHGIGPGEQPTLGVEVQVAGELVSAGTIYARELWYDPGAEVQEFSGFIRRLPDDLQFPQTWVIEDSAVGTCDVDENPDAEACKSVLVTESTFLDISEASPADGAPVRVRARRNPDGFLEALWVQVLAGD